MYIGHGEDHRRLCRVKNMLAMYLKYHKAELTPNTPVTNEIKVLLMANVHGRNLHSQTLAVFQLYRGVIITERPSMKYYTR
jgi:hypothetical protein